MKKWEHLCALGRNVKWCIVVENSLVVPEKVNIELPIWPRNSIPNYVPKGIKKAEFQADTHTQTFNYVNHHSIIYNPQKVKTI